MTGRFVAGGKVALDHIYTQEDPRGYFGTLRDLDYVIPQLAKPHFAKMIRELHGAADPRPVTVVDLGCGYGVNSALLRCDATMDELYRHYCGADSAMTRSALLALDRSFVRARTGTTRTRFIGLDISGDALAYACEAGFLDAAVQADLERDDPTPEQRTHLIAADLVISTGCIGYVSERTLLRIARAADTRLPWMAHTVLRMYSYEPVMSALAAAGYETTPVGELLRQRRFASAQEQALVLATLSDLGVDPHGLETDGWMYAQLFVSRPRPGAS
jgi:carnitine O-acetyltransferase